MRDNFLERSSGVLMHISSLPGKYGIGSLGKEARDFGKFLADTGQKYWQTLPIGPTSYGDSPYQSFSTFAGNPYFIDLDILKDEGLLDDSDLEILDYSGYETEIDYSLLYNERFITLKKAYDRFEKNALYYKFKEENEFWLDDYALYMAIKITQNNLPWTKWDNKFKFRDYEAIFDFKNSHEEEIEFYKFLQYQFFKQWNDLRDYLLDLGIEIIGDIPIYVAEDSADTWGNPEVFKLDKDLNPTVVAGVPPDYFSENGQLWGNPIYDWQYLKSTDYKWWVDRVSFAFEIFDVIRFDHFRALHSYYEVEYGLETAKIGKWKLGPGMDFIDTLEKEIDGLKMIAEDLGDLGSDVKKFVAEAGFPGMKIMVFAFSGDYENEYLPHNVPKNSVYYVGTHDNETVSGFIDRALDYEMAFAKDYLNLTLDEGYNFGFIRGAMTSPSDLCIIQIQDIVNSDKNSRMNIPSTLGDNWKYRLKATDLNIDIKNKFSNITKISGRHQKYKLR